MLRVKEINPENVRHNANLFQSRFWANFKENRGYETQAFYIEYCGQGKPMIVIHRPCSNDAAFGYVPHGPDISVRQDRQGPFLEEICDKVRRELPDNCSFLRFDLPWKNPYVFESDDGIKECLPPEPRIREMRMNFGCREWNLCKSPTDMQPLSTVILDTTRRASVMLRNMHPKARYSIRKSFRSGIKVYRKGIEGLSSWHRIYTDMSKRKGLAAEGLSFFKDLFITAGSFQSELRLYLACHKGVPVAGNIIAFHGGNAYYLYSAASSRGRKTLASYAALWKSVLDSRIMGCHSFDLMGIPPNRDPDHPMAGLYRFKTRLGGKIVHFRGCWDYPFESKRYSSLAFISARDNPFYV